MWTERKGFAEEKHKPFAVNSLVVPPLTTTLFPIDLCREFCELTTKGWMIWQSNNTRKWENHFLEKEERRREKVPMEISRPDKMWQRRKTCERVSSRRSIERTRKNVSWTKSFENFTTREILCRCFQSRFSFCSNEKSFLVSARRWIDFGSNCSVDMKRVIWFVAICFLFMSTLFDLSTVLRFLVSQKILFDERRSIIRLKVFRSLRSCLLIIRFQQSFLVEKFDRRRNSSEKWVPSSIDEFHRQTTSSIERFLSNEALLKAKLATDGFFDMFLLWLN